jgi:hypothetical protein
MSETLGYRQLDRNEQSKFKRLIGHRDFEEYEALMTKITENHIVVSALFVDEMPENPLEAWMDGIEIVTNERGRNSLTTDNEGRFNLESGIVDMEYFPDWRDYDIDIWSDDSGEDIEEMETVQFPEIDSFIETRRNDVYLEDVTKYIAHLREFSKRFGYLQSETIANINEYIDAVLDFERCNQPNPHNYTGSFDGGYGYGWIEAVVIPSDELVKEFLGYGDDGAQKLQDYLKDSLKTYGCWARGEVYGYISKAFINGEEVYEDSCWGYYGDDAAKELQEVHESVVARQKKKQQHLDEIRAMFLPESELVNA